MNGFVKFAAVVALALTPAATAANDTLVGVGITNISWQQPAVIAQTLLDIRDADFEAVRIAWKGSLDWSRIALREASAQGLAILLVLPLTDGPISRDGAAARPRTGSFFAVNGLSQIDPDRLRQQVDGLLEFLADSGITLAGIEMGNEMNWAAFNGDLPLGRQGRVISDLAQFDPDTRRAFEDGIAAYADAVDIVSDALRRHGQDGKIPLVMGALADIDAAFVIDSGATLVSAGIARALLVEEQVFDKVDAVGVHLYEPLQLNVEPSSRLAMIGEKLDVCATPAFGNQPCWITEYGIAAWQSQCDIVDADRRASIGALTHYLSAPGNASRIEATFFYDWVESGTYSLMRCGRLSALASDLTGHLP